MHHPEHSTLIIPLIDARRMDVYAAVFDARGQMMAPITFQTLSDDSFNDLGYKKIAFCGNGLTKYKV
ncbi:MAG: hypothetical protein IPN29_12895 [Saprospiraceae bacterium]|nr:hypothetical protein [Saprospiraceae bacterium]